MSAVIVNVKMPQRAFHLTVIVEGVSGFPEEAGQYVDCGLVVVEDTQWSVCIYRGGMDIMDQGYCSIYLRSARDVRAALSLTLINHLDEEASVTAKGTISYSGSSTGGGTGRFVSSTDLVDPSKGFIRSDTITIVADVIVFGAIQTTSIAYTQSSYCSCGLVDDIHGSLFNESSCDFYILASEKMEADSSTPMTGDINYLQLQPHVYNDRIPVHRFILQARSPVFRAMLSSGMVECTLNQIVMSDFRCNVVREFVRFLYTDTCCDTSMLMQHARSLLALAHKYEVKGLVHECERYLVGTLSADNAVELLQLADKYESKELKGRALQFIKINFSSIIQQSSLFYESLTLELKRDLITALAHSGNT